MPFITQGKTNWKFLLIVIILAVIVGGGALWFSVKKELPYQPPEIKKVDETANWKTYKSEEYGFEFKYPGEYDNYPECKINKVDKGIEIGNTFLIEVLDSGGLSLLSYVEREKEISIAPPPSVSWTQENISIGSINGIKVVWIYGARYSNIIYLLKDSKIYQISFNAGMNCSEEIITKNIPSELEVFEQIPSTFRFIENYTACGCGCCGGVEPTVKCLYHSKGDDIQKIIENDKQAAQNPACPQMGCSHPIKYIYCD